MKRNKTKGFGLLADPLALEILSCSLSPTLSFPRVMHACLVLNGSRRLSRASVGFSGATETEQCDGASKGRCWHEPFRTSHETSASSPEEPCHQPLEVQLTN